MPKLQRTIASVADWLAVSGGYIASTALLLMSVGVTLDVLARFFLGAGTKFAVEMSGYGLVVIVFFGLAYTHKTNGHIEIDFVVSRLSDSTKRRLRVVNTVVFLVYTVVLGYFGWKTFWTSYQFNTTSRTGLDVEVWPYQLVIPLGLAIATLLLASNLYVQITRGVELPKSDSTVPSHD